MACRNKKKTHTNTQNYKQKYLENNGRKLFSARHRFGKCTIDEWNDQIDLSPTNYVDDWQNFAFGLVRCEWALIHLVLGSMKLQTTEECSVLFRSMAF